MLIRFIIHGMYLKGTVWCVQVLDTLTRIKQILINYVVELQVMFKAYAGILCACTALN